MALIIAKFEVFARTNQGEEQTVPASDSAEAIRVAKRLRTPKSSMVCIIEDGVRTMRWDRSQIVGENRWRKVDPGAFEKLGAVRECVRTYVHTTVEQEIAKHEAWLAACPSDNQEFANTLNAQLQAAAVERAPRLRKAITNVYEGLGIRAMLKLLRETPLSIETRLKYQALEKRLRLLHPKYAPFEFHEECCGIKHPTADLSLATVGQLKERGFVESEGWRDARGVRVLLRSWLEVDTERPRRNGGYGWYDPAGIREIYETYKRDFDRLERKAGTKLAFDSEPIPARGEKPSTLALTLKAEKFDEIKAGRKLEEYCLDTPHWQKCLEGPQYEFVELIRGSPRGDEEPIRLRLPWRGYRLITITDPDFGSHPVEVFAINVSVPARPDPLWGQAPVDATHVMRRPGSEVVVWVKIANSRLAFFRWSTQRRWFSHSGGPQALLANPTIEARPTAEMAS